jgi:predicted ATP-dependent protease
MTGEVSLRGKVIAVGGLKEKIMAAYRAGIKTVVFPSDNQKDIVEVPETVRAKMTLIPVGGVDEVFRYAFVGVAERIAELEARKAARRKARNRRDVKPKRVKAKRTRAATPKARAARAAQSKR